MRLTRNYLLPMDAGSGQQSTLTDRRIAPLHMLNFTGFHLLHVLLEVDDGGLLDERQSILVHRFNAGLLQRVLGAAADLGDEDRMTVVDGANDGVQAVFFSEAALAVEVHAAMTHKLGTGRAQLVHLKFLGVAEVFVDAPAAPGGHGNQDLDVAALARQSYKFGLFGRNLGLPLHFYLFLVGLARSEVVIDVHLHDLVGGELGAAIFAEQTHGIGATLAAVAHHVHLAFAAVLQRFQLLRRRTTLSRQPEDGAVLRRGDQRHDVVQKCAARLYRPVHFHQVLIVHTGNHDRIHFAQDSSGRQHLKSLQLPFGEYPCAFHAGVPLVFVEHPRIDLGADLRVNHVDSDGYVIDFEALDGFDVIGKHEPVGGEAELDIGRGLRNQLECLEGLLRIGQGIAGPGDAEHRHLRDGGSNGKNFLCCLFRSEFFADHAGARLIGAVVLAVAVVALNVAGRRHGNVHARVMMVRFLAVAGMILDLLPDLRRQVALACRGAATGLAAAGFGAAALLLSHLLHDLARRLQYRQLGH